MSKHGQRSKGGGKSPLPAQRARAVKLGPAIAGHVSFTTDILPIPDRVYYANTVNLERTQLGIFICFGQVFPRQDEFGSVVCLEMAESAFKVFLNTLHPGFRMELNQFCETYGHINTKPWLPSERDIPAVLMLVHGARIFAADAGCTLDFFQLTHGNAPENVLLESMIRIRCLPPVLAALVARCDELAR